MRAGNRDRLLREAKEAARRAYCPYSKYRVGAALLCADGTVVRGCNVENASYGLTLCAERNALQAAVAAGHRRFRALAIVASGRDPPYPCGACLQVMAEFCGPRFPVYAAVAGRPGSARRLCLGKLLPRRFAFRRS